LYLSLAFAAPSQIIAMLAPGNASRAVASHHPFWDTAHLGQWIGDASRDGVHWLAHPQILLLACCLLLLRPSETWPEVSRIPRLAAWAALAVTNRRIRRIGTGPDCERVLPSGSRRRLAGILVLVVSGVCCLGWCAQTPFPRVAAGGGLVFVELVCGEPLRILKLSRGDRGS
jgi:hypothetical protein